MGHRHTDYVSVVLKKQDGFENSVLMYNRSQCHCNRILSIAGGTSQLLPHFSVLKRVGFLLENIAKYILIYDFFTFIY